MISSPLEALDFSKATRGADGLVSVHKASKSLPIDEELAVRQAQLLGDIDYVFFRRFSDDRSSQVAAYVIDNETGRLDDAHLANVHRRLWLNGTSPLLYVGRATSVDVLTCAAGPEFWSAEGSLVYRPSQIVDTTTAISNALLDRFSARRLSDGTFWDDPRNARLADADSAAHSLLIRAVVEADQALGGAKQPVLRRLLLLTVLIKYLEDRDVFPIGWMGRYHNGATSFLDLLKDGTPDDLRKMLRALEEKFNGDVFGLPIDGPSLTLRMQRRLADLVGKRLIGAQSYLWEAFSFQHIPVEVLSHLYQHFTVEGSGAVFTPPFLARLVLDYAMPYASLSGDERVLDPTCGSGVFLVGAFKRLVSVWRKKNGWKQPDVRTLKGILRNSIFGVELHAEAADLAAFSLALAVCDSLQPTVIWSELRFDKLSGRNIRSGDIVQALPGLAKDTGVRSFDVLLGNPPFLSLAPGRLPGPAVPDNQLAYWVAREGMSLLGNGKVLALIQPAGLLYNKNVQALQGDFFSKHQVNLVLDFASIRNLFDGADTKTVAIIARNVAPQRKHFVSHLTFRRTASVRQRLCFELDHYDRHTIAQPVAEKFPLCWRAGLLGGGRLLQLAERLSSFPTLKTHLASKGWNAGEGFIAGRRGRKKATWLSGLRYLPTEALNGAGLEESQIEILTETSFVAPRTEDRFCPPLFLIKEHESLPTAFWNKGKLAFKDKIVGVRAPASDARSLEAFSREFAERRDVLRACVFLLGSQILIGKSTAILKKDLDVLPWPSDGDLNLTKWEKILCDDVVSDVADFVRLGEGSRLLRKNVTKSSLSDYAGVFVDLLGSLFPDLHPGPGGRHGGLAFQVFLFGKAPGTMGENGWIERLTGAVRIDHGDVLRTIRVLRFYDGDAMLIVKPDRLRYWIRSTAIRDADETLVDLQRQGMR